MAKYAVHAGHAESEVARNGQSSSASPGMQPHAAVATVSGMGHGMVSAPPPMTSVHGAPVTMHAGQMNQPMPHGMMMPGMGMPPRPPPGMHMGGPYGHAPAPPPQFAAAMGMPPMG